MVGLLPDSPTVYPLGFQPANSSTDCACGRARVGYWAKNKGNIYTAPWLQSMEFLIVEWDGVKTVWGNDDVVTPTQEYKKAIKEFFQFGHERDYGSPQRMAMFYNPNSNPRTGLFADTLAALMWQCREKRKQRPTPERPDNRRARGQGTLAVIERGLPPAAPPETGLHGHGPPDVSLGVDGDTYVDDDSQALFWKSGGVWKP
jgi:hypothetical protein